MTSPTARIAAVVSVAAGCFALDQVTKRIALALLVPGRRLSYLGDVFRLDLVHNRGAFLSLGAGLDDTARALLFTWGTAALIAGALVVALRRRTSPVTGLGAALVAGGGLGNLWDRVTAGGVVTDFLNLGLGPLRTGIFNVADLAIVGGVLVVALHRGPARERS